VNGISVQSLQLLNQRIPIAFNFVIFAVSVRITKTQLKVIGPCDHSLMVEYG